MTDEKTTYLTPAQVCARLNDAMTERTLGNWRCDKRGLGPPFVRVGKKIRYPLDDLIKWEGERKFVSTHDYAAPPLPPPRAA